MPTSHGIVSRSGNDSTRSSPSQAASSARQRRARSSLGATTTTLRRATSTSEAHANARAPPVASAIFVERRSSRRSESARKRSLRSASARMPPSRAVDPSAVVLAIELVHRAFDAVADGHLGRLRPADDHLLRLRPLVGRERREHIRGEVPDLGGRIRGRDPEPQSREAFADLTGDRAHPVVRAWSAALAQPHLAERQVDLVEDDEQRVRREPVAVEELSHRTPAVVHERLRSRDRDTEVAQGALRDARFGGLRVELEARALREPVRDLETDVVTRIRVAVARIPEADDKTIDARRARTCEQLRQTDQVISPLSMSTPKRGSTANTGGAPRDAYR